MRFTRNNGWWAAFWLYGETNRNAFEDGSEIDIFEDYYTRIRRGRLPGQIEFDHNLHMSYGQTLKSDKRTSAFAGDLDAFHTVGCRWSPLGVAFYVDGRLQTNTIAGAKEKAAFFDAFAAGAIRTPLHVILSGQIFKTWGAKDLTGMVFPEHYLVDWVRVWRCPEDSAGPRLNWRLPPHELSVCAPGTECALEVAANPADEIECAWLFDGGAFLATRTAPPWRFTVPFSQAGFAATQWGVPGRQGAVPPWDARLHSFAVYARDRQGRVGVTSVPNRAIVTTALTNAPTLAVAAAGKGAWTFRPASGRNCAWTTGDTRQATFTAEKGGCVTGRVRYHAGKSHPSRLWLVVDGRCVAAADCPPAADGTWRAQCVSPDFTFDLSPGAHTLALVAVGHIVLETIELHLDL